MSRFPIRAILAASCALFATSALAEEEVNLYTHRHYEADDALFATFTEKTGIKVKVIKAGADELIERIKSEGEASPADVFVTADASHLHRAKEAGLLQPIQNDTLSANIPANLCDPEGYWFGLTERARVIVYAKDRIKPEELSTYAALAGDDWKGRILVRSSSNIYNQSLLASIVAAKGEDAARDWAAAVRKNMARPPQGSDRDQMRAVAAGLGDIAIVNTYYLGILTTSDDEKDREVAAKMAVFFPNQEERGAHVNVSGAGIVKNSKNKENAIALIEFLCSVEAQEAFASATFEYPVNPAAERSDLLKSWGEFKPDDLDLSQLGTNNAAAVKIFDEVGWE